MLGTCASILSIFIAILAVIFGSLVASKHSSVQCFLMTPIGSEQFWTGKHFKESDIAVLPEGEGKTALITGGNSGVGYESARALAAKGYTVFITCRSRARCDDAVQEMLREHPSQRDRIQRGVRPLLMDLSDLDSIAAGAATFIAESGNKFDIVMLNAGKNHHGQPGAPFLDRSGELEAMFADMHVGHFYLTNLLWSSILTNGQRTKDVRLIVVASGTPFYWGTDLKPDWALHAGKRGFNESDVVTRGLPRVFFGIKDRAKGMGNYCLAKMANQAFARKLARVLPDPGSSGVYINAVTPGITRTRFTQGLDSKVFDYIENIFMFSPKYGALTQLQVATTANPTHDSWHVPLGQDMGYTSGLWGVGDSPFSSQIGVQEDLYRVTVDFLSRHASGFEAHF